MLPKYYLTNQPPIVVKKIIGKVSSSLIDYYDRETPSTSQQMSQIPPPIELGRNNYKRQKLTSIIVVVVFTESTLLRLVVVSLASPVSPTAAQVCLSLARIVSKVILTPLTSSIVLGATTHYYSNYYGLHSEYLHQTNCCDFSSISYLYLFLFLLI